MGCVNLMAGVMRSEIGVSEEARDHSFTVAAKARELEMFTRLMKWASEGALEAALKKLEAAEVSASSRADGAKTSSE